MSLRGLSLGWCWLIIWADKFCVDGNNTASSLARRDKFLMAERLRNATLKYIKYTKSDDIADILSWVRREGLEIVVMKPLLSSGTYGFHICRSESEITQAFQALYHSKDIFGNVSREVLVQEYIQGQEYAINIVSYNGFNYVSEIWKTDKVPCLDSKVYDLETLLPEASPEFGVLSEYSFAVLKALEIEYGASHTEVIIDDRTGQPVLIETAARFMGSLDLSLVTEAYGVNAVLLTAEAYLQSDSFLKLVKQQEVRRCKKYPAMVQLISSQEGVLVQYNLDRLHSLNTFYGADIYVRPGGCLEKTVNSYSSPGLVFLLGKNKTEVLADYRVLREMERKGELYVLKQ